MLALALAGVHVFWAEKEERASIPENKYISEKERAPVSTLTEVILLSENDEKLTSWDIYGKNGLVIGRDIGENQVDINLDQTTYASMIDIEHAVLNFSGNDWYVEDISVKNGVSIQKTDGKKYKLAYGKPCKLERGDIVCVALTRLQVI
ncbi:hypothetical protein CG709_02420 [Lachnotalea glycerini]|nr:hypothetical protein CG709_02420 [Lachnotalea glycerini]